MGESPFGKGPKGGTTTAVKAPRKASPKAAAKAEVVEEETGGGVEMGTNTGGGDPFNMPSGGGSDYKIAEFMGELLLIKPTENGKMMTKVSKDGPSEFVRVDLYRLENEVDGEVEFVEDLLVFQEALIRNFKKVMRGPNEWLVGRLARGEAKKGPDSAPYILEEPTEEEVGLIRQFGKDEGLW